MNSLLSIIIPVYNTEHLLEQCVNSVLEQDYMNIEVILVDDGSTDKSLEVCNTFKEKDNRVKVYTQANLGQAAARNFGVKVSNGEYITFVDSDDFIEKDSYATNMKLLKENLGISFLQFPAFMNFGHKNAYFRNQIERIYNSGFYKLWLQDKIISWTVWDKIFTKEVFNKTKFKENILFEDNLFISEILKTVDQIYISPHGKYYYVYRENSTVNSQLSRKRELDSFYVTDSILSKIDDINIKIDFLLRAYNIKKSLNKNFNEYVQINKSSLNKISLIDIFKSKVGFKNKIKLMLSKYEN